MEQFQGLTTGLAALILFAITGGLLLFAQYSSGSRFGRVAALTSLPTACAAIYCTFVAFSGHDDLGDVIAGSKEHTVRLFERALPATDAVSVNAAASTDKALHYRGSGLPGDEFKDCPTCPLMVVVPNGYGFVGAAPTDLAAKPEELPRRAVRLPARLALSRYEVTANEYAAFVAATGHRAPSCPQGHRPTRDGEPVHCISPTDVLAYVAWLRKITGRPYRLPTQVEWEFAARAGSERAYLVGENEQPIELEVARAAAAPRPVGELPANRFGLHGVQGGVAEIVADCWYPNLVPLLPSGKSLDPSGYCKWYTIKDGAWMESAARARLSARRPIGREHRDGGIGFRLARDVPPGSFSN